MRSPALIVILIAASPAAARAFKPAEPVASATADVDGDGKTDTVTVDATGITVDYAGKRADESKALTSSGPVESAEITIGGPAGTTPFIAITARVRSAGGLVHDAVVLRDVKGTLTEVWRGPVGPVGRDGDHALHVEASAVGLLRYQSRAGFERCDGASPQLFLEGWDDKGRKFRSIRRATAVDAGAPTLTATRTAPATAPTGSAVYRAAAASTEGGAGDASALGAPHQLDDGDPATAWREDRGGDGRGEWFTFKARSKGATLEGLRILPGDARSAQQMAAANRVARLAVVTKDRAFWVEIPDDIKTDEAAGGAWWVSLPKGVAADCVTVVLDGFHPAKGAKAGAGESKIAELIVLAREDLAAGGADAAWIADVIAGGLPGDTAAKLLGRRGAAAARAIEAALATGLPGDAEVRLWRILARIGDPGSAAALGTGLAARGVKDEVAIELADGLVKLGDAGQLELVGVVAAPKAGEVARIAAAERVADAHRDGLVTALGSGPRALRKAIAVRIAGAGATWLTAQITQAIGDGAVDREADLLRALGVAAERAAADRAAAIELLARRSAEVTDYERRYRIVAALAPLPDAAATAALEAILGSLGADASGAALAQVAAAGLARSPSRDAAGLLATLTDHADPGVRIAALKGLAGGAELPGGAWTDGGGADAIDRLVIDALADRWPEVRHTATAALALACPRIGPTRALENTADRDDDDGVRGDALSALVTCRAPGIADRLVAAARNGKLSAPLRERAVDLLGALGDPSVIATLIAELERWRGAAFSEQSALVLAQRAAVVLGGLGALSGDRTDVAAARAALIATAEDPYFPEIQAAGAAGLGALGRHCDGAAQKLLRELARSDQAAVKIAAGQALGTCGK